MNYVFAILALVTATLATIAHDLKYSILSMWIAGLATGAIFLTVDAEFLGIVQWIVSTLVAISFVFFGVMFGDFESNEKKKGKANYLMVSCASVLGLSFSALLWLAMKDNARLEITTDTHAFEIKEVGKALVSTHILSLEVLAITLFLVLVGCGAIARIEKGDPK